MGLPLSRPRLQASWAVLSVTSSTVTESGGLGGPGIVWGRGKGKDRGGGDTCEVLAHAGRDRPVCCVQVCSQKAAGNKERNKTKKNNKKRK